MSRPTCSSCTFWNAFENAGKKDWQGECRINPPELLVSPEERSIAQLWPPADGDDWCGMWETAEVQ